MTMFKNSCAIIDYPCVVGRTYINPCSCSTYLQCSHEYDVIVRLCSTGTVWDHVEENCLGTNQVVIDNKRCVLETPWRRCKDVPETQQPSTLRKICSEISNNDDGNDDESDGGGGGGSSAAVVGGVLGGLLVLIIIGIIVYAVVKRKSLPELYRSIKDIYKPNRQDQQNEPVEEVYDVIDEKQVSTSQPIDNPGYEKQSKPRDIVYNNTADSNSHSETPDGAGGLDNKTYSTLKPNDYNDMNRSYSTLRPTQEEDLSRTIPVNGTDVAVQDKQGYFIGYPSGTVPRQPSPTPANIGDDADDGYSLGKAPEPDVQAQPISRLPSEYFILQPSQEAQNE